MHFNIEKWTARVGPCRVGKSESRLTLKLGYVALGLRRASSGASDSPSPPHVLPWKSKHLTKKEKTLSLSLSLAISP